MNADLFVNVKHAMEQFGGGAELHVERRSTNDFVVHGPGVSHVIEFKVLRRPTPTEIHQAADRQCFLVLVEPNQVAREAANSVNHVSLPNGDIRLVLPGLVVIAPETRPESKPSLVRLSGASGVVAETILLDPSKVWTMRELADDAKVSLGLAQRVAERLEREGYIKSASGRGRVLADGNGLIRLWAQENRGNSKPFAKGYFYAGNPIEAARTFSVGKEEMCIGGALAANTYVSRLTTIPPPYRIWVPLVAATPDELRNRGLQLVTDGANFEFYAVTGDVWRTHAKNLNGVFRISRPRCYVELYNTRGRLQELAEALLQENP